MFLTLFDVVSVVNLDDVPNTVILVSTLCLLKEYVSCTVLYSNVNVEICSRGCLY